MPLLAEGGHAEDDDQRRRADLLQHRQVWPGNLASLHEFQGFASRERMCGKDWPARLQVRASMFLDLQGRCMRHTPASLSPDHDSMIGS